MPGARRWPYVARRRRHKGVLGRRLAVARGRWHRCGVDLVRRFCALGREKRPFLTPVDQPAPTTLSSTESRDVFPTLFPLSFWGPFLNQLEDRGSSVRYSGPRKAISSKLKKANYLGTCLRNLIFLTNVLFRLGDFRVSCLM